MFKKRLNKLQLGELRALHQLVRNEAFKLKAIEGNTALVTGGQAWINTQKDIVKQLERAREDYVSTCCTELGISGKVSVNLSNGKINES